MSDKFVSLDLAPSAVLAVILGDVYLRATVIEHDTEEECVAVASLEMYHSAIGKFLARKAEYCRKGDFCGSEFIVSDDFETSEDPSWLHDELGSKKFVPTLVLNSIHVEMEHG